MLRGERTTPYTVAIIILVAQASCSSKAVEVASATPNHLPPSPVLLQPTPSPSSTPNSPIRRVDFRNFTYPEPRYGYLYDRDYSAKGFGRSRQSVNTLHTLIDGREPLIEDKEGLWENSPAGLGLIDYADVTGDGNEEALIPLGISVRGSAILNYLYVYAWEKTRPKMLLAFEAGDRADGGFRRMYADKGELLIELNAGDEKAPDCDGCQATRFTRLHYKWNGRRFVLMSSELLPITR